MATGGAHQPTARAPLPYLIPGSPLLRAVSTTASREGFLTSMYLTTNP